MIAYVVKFMDVVDIPISNFIISDSNTRKDLSSGNEDASIDDLANSILEKGLLNPITVIKKNNQFEIIIGQRRYLACKRLGLSVIPSIIRDDVSEIDATILSLIENVQRADMHPLDKAKVYKKLYETYDDYTQVSKETGVTIPTIKRYISLLELSPVLQTKVNTTDGVSGVAALSKLATTFSPDKQETAYNTISGFKQNIQVEIIKRSKGDLNTLDSLKDQAMEGAFNTRLCHEGLCFTLPESLKNEIQEMIEKNPKILSLKDYVKSL